MSHFKIEILLLKVDSLFNDEVVFIGDGQFFITMHTIIHVIIHSHNYSIIFTNWKTVGQNK
jgi:hypothetical protein